MLSVSYAIFVCTAFIYDQILCHNWCHNVKRSMECLLHNEKTYNF